MKKGKSLVELAQTLEDIRATAKDYLVPATKLTMTDEAKLSFQNGDLKTLEPTPYAHSQIATYTNIPKAYYDRIRGEDPGLLAQNVNHGIAKQSEGTGRGGKIETRMVRTHGEKIRAVLSSSYRRLDSYDLAQTVLPVMADSQMEIVSSEITDTRLYIKALTPKIQTEIKQGDVVQFGLMVSNSDVGAGSVRVEPLIYRLVCKNGLIANTSIKKFHVGRNMAGDDVTELLTEETLNLTDSAFWAQVRDILIASMKPERFELEVNRLREAAALPIKNFDLPEVVELSMKAVGVSGERTKDNILAYLANGADGAGLTQWGLINGFTFAAQQDNVDYDQSIELERAGSKILELNPRQWRRIAEEVQA